jgi:hypothetical protein
MAFGNLGRTIAGQALETTKKNVLDAIMSEKPAEKPAPGAAAHQPEPIGAVILNQMQAMQRALKEDQELLVLFNGGGEKFRVLEVFVPSLHVFVLAGVDSDQNVTRVVIPAESAQLVCKIVKVAEGAKPVRVNVLSPRPPAATTHSDQR